MLAKQLPYCTDISSFDTVLGLEVVMSLYRTWRGSYVTVQDMER